VRRRLPYWVHGAAVLGLALVLASTGCGAREASSGAAGGEGAPARLMDPDLGISVRYPANWHATTSPLTEVMWPPQRLAVASFPIRQPHPDPNCWPQTAHEAMPPDGAFLFVLEYTTGGPASAGLGEGLPEFPPRPDHFQLTDFENFECYRHSYMIRFRDGGRRFQAHVTLGEEATAETRAQALTVLDSLRVDPSAEASRTAVPCRDPDYPGPWTACPLMRRVRRAIENAGFDVFFDQGAAWFATDHETATFSVGVVTGTNPAADELDPALTRIGGTVVRGDWELRIHWQAGDYTWWLESQAAPERERDPLHWNLRLPRGDVLARLVRASRAVADTS
jgi:hypothetical protein